MALILVLPTLDHDDSMLLLTMKKFQYKLAKRDCMTQGIVLGD